MSKSIIYCSHCNSPLVVLKERRVYYLGNGTLMFIFQKAKCPKIGRLGRLFRISKHSQGEWRLDKLGNVEEQVPSPI